MTATSRRLKLYLKMTIIIIYLKNGVRFPFTHTRLFLSIEGIVPPINMIFEYEYSKSFQKSGGNCIVKILLKM